MWVRCQNKGQLIDAQYVFILGTGFYTRCPSGQTIYLGEYDSNKRCVEIMDEIERRINTFPTLPVYQMPEN